MVNNMAKKSVMDVGEQVPKTLKFGIIVALALLWTQFLRGILVGLLLLYFNSDSDTMVDFIIAVIATIFGWLILITYPKIMSRMRRVKM